MPLAEFVTGPGKTALEEDELLVAIECDALPGYGGSFEKVGHRRSLVISLVCLADAGEARCVRDAGSRTCASPSAASARSPMPLSPRSENIPARRPSQRPSGCEQAADMPVDLVASRTRQAYRREVVRGFVLRGLIEAVRGAGGELARARSRAGGGLCLSFASRPPSTAARSARSAKPHLRLLDFLRDDLDLTGTKEGCGAGECGTCSVFVDGVLLKSCLRAGGEGAGRQHRDGGGAGRARGELSVLQQAFHKTGASQCGYCIPGMVMAATAALRANPFAETARRSRSGSAATSAAAPATRRSSTRWSWRATCRTAAGRRAALAEEEPADGAFIGANVRRLDAPSKVSGALKYAGDMVHAGHAARGGAAQPARRMPASFRSTPPRPRRCPASRG